MYNHSQFHCNFDVFQAWKLFAKLVSGCLVSTSSLLKVDFIETETQSANVSLQLVIGINISKFELCTALLRQNRVEIL